MNKSPPTAKRKSENPVKIVRYADEIKFEDGTTSHIQCRMGSFEEVKEAAERFAKENDTEVVIIL